MKKILTVTLSALLLCLGYLIVFGALIFHLPLVVGSEHSYDIQTMMTPSDEVTHAYLVEDTTIALDLRLAMIGAAEHTINIAYYSIHNDKLGELFFGALLAAADRGVRVNIILDHIVSLKVKNDTVFHESLMFHENIRFMYYEPVNPLRPYTLQNRLHDKILMVDGVYGLTGGRNIGERFLDANNTTVKTYDRDVFVFGDGTPHETVVAMDDYFATLSDHPFTKEMHADATTARKTLKDSMRALYSSYTEENDLPATLATIKAAAIVVERATFVTNPISRLHKDPVVLKTLAELAEHHDTWVIQSPYLSLSPLMREYLPDTEGKAITVLSNSLSSNSNTIMMSGHALFRTEIAEHATLYEYQDEHSIHAKSFIFGSEISVIGAYNIDPRSTTLSTENVMVILSETFTDEVRAAIDGLILQSLEVSPDGTYRNGPGPGPVDIPRIRRKTELVAFFTRFFTPML